MKLTPDQLHRLIDEVSELVNMSRPLSMSIYLAAIRALGDQAGSAWYDKRAAAPYWSAGGHAGLSAVLILLSEGG